MKLIKLAFDSTQLLPISDSRFSVSLFNLSTFRAKIYKEKEN